MCKLGDIIIVKKFKGVDGELVSRHSFVIINDEEDYVEGLKYDFVANMMCSFHDEEHRKKKLKYKENLEIKKGQIIGTKLNANDGYIKSNQLYFFKKNKIKYKLIAHMEPELLDELVKLILELHEQNKLKDVLTNIE